jgi:succinate dehydrogenase / fumarate reductase iron-sulfur subunit
MAEIKAKIFRYNPDKDKQPYFQDYNVKTDRSFTVHELLTVIHHDHDGTLAYRQFKCYKGMCTTCLVKLNGKVVKGCSTQVEPGSEITLEPAAGGDLIRDLVVDFKAM